MFPNIFPSLMFINWKRKPERLKTAGWREYIYQLQNGFSYYIK